MDILLISTEFPPQPGGIGHHAFNLAKYLNREGLECAVVCESRDKLDYPEECDFDLCLPFEVYRVPRKERLVSRFSQRLKQVIQLSKDSNIILIASGLWPLFLVGFLKFLRLRNQKAVYIAHAVDVNPSNTLLKKICHFMLSQFNQIVSVSAYTREKLPYYLQSKVSVIPNGFDIERFTVKHKVNRRLKGYPRLITLGSVTARKGQINIVNALPLILKAYPNAYYHIIGLPVEKEFVLACAQSLGVQDHIHFHGALEDSEMIPYLSQADVFMMLSNHTPDGDFEGFGIAILEAAYLGVPAIGAKGTGIEDAISNGKSGFLIDPHCPEEVEAAVKQILSSSSYFSKQSKDHATSFSWEFIAPQYIDVLKSMGNTGKL